MYYISTYLAIALYNDDFSALNDDEIELIEDIREREFIIDFNYINFTKCHLTGLLSDCYKIEFN
jgi:hypothetical protein